ncbi:ACT domain-containing protein [Breznakiella homolactica]|uniref:ACT domain-containing protein n=1 Tax=Breznakiella homolactica TaxID=2798577 RepID=A0A7T8BAV6_9SPIR|nr:ACT domain-containing protein [Breznakiella homolactica]QQO09410.1 ACT domain-containing protein [Breznakiella homolactica]
MNLKLLDGEYSVYRYGPAAQLPADVFAGAFVSVTKTGDELSVTAPAGSLGGYEKAETGWRLFRVSGTLEFSMIGIISRISAVLAEAEVSIFVVSTYDTDYIMIKEVSLEKAVQTLRGEGYTVN